MVMGMKIFSAALIAVALAGPANAQNFSGNEISAACSSGNPVQEGFCYGWIVGTWEGVKIGAYRMVAAAGDAFDSTEDADAFVNQVLNTCIPPEVSNGQIVGVFQKFLSDSPAVTHGSARTLLMVALAEAFPCN